jgi:hypothetical protein
MSNIKLNPRFDSYLVGEESPRVWVLYGIKGQTRKRLSSHDTPAGAVCSLVARTGGKTLEEAQAALELGLKALLGDK